MFPWNSCVKNPKIFAFQAHWWFTFGESGLTRTKLPIQYSLLLIIKNHKAGNSSLKVCEFISVKMPLFCQYRLRYTLESKPIFLTVGHLGPTTIPFSSIILEHSQGFTFDSNFENFIAISCDCATIAQQTCHSSHSRGFLVVGL